jgi:4-amino-4-deoxy-L-arabinose transferase-like glycosyltransferase
VAEVPNGRIVWALVGLHLVFCALLFEPKLHTGGDSSEYVILAESVLRVGDGYADTMTPGEPVPHTKYPPLYPILLAPLVALFGRSFVVLKLLSVAFTATSVGLFALWARERIPSRLWLPVSLALAVNPVVIDYSRWLLSEAPFLLFSVLALLFLERGRDGEELDRDFWLALGAILAAYYVRGIGVMFLVAGSLYYLFTKRWKRFAAFNVVGAGLSLPWLVRNRLVSGEATPYLEQFLLKSVYEPELGYHDFGGLVGRFFNNVAIYAGRELPRVFAGSDSVWSVAPPMIALSVTLAVLVLVGFGARVRERAGIADLYFALSCVAVFLFEEVVSDVRYLMPLVPLLLVYVVDGISAVTRLATRSAERVAPAVAVLALVTAVGVLAQLQRAPANVAMLRQVAGGDPLAGYHPAWRSFFQASDWIAANTQEDAVVTVRKPRLFYLWTGRRVREYPFSTDPDSVLSVVLETDYVLIDQISGTTGRYLVPAVQSAQDRFLVVHQTRPPVNFVLEVVPEGGAAR